MAKTTIPTGGLADNAVTAAKATGFGKTGQLVITQDNDVASHITTTSTTPADTGISRTITCAATSSKVLVRFYTGMAASPTDTGVRFSLYRDSTNLSSNAYNWGLYRVEPSDSGTNYSALNLEWLDSPSSTSEIDYKIYYESSSGSAVYACQDGGQYQLTCTEILA
jgi:hypothetical protein|tara:strand:+ start:114 stop:611 length:498 start_codon:yes stop_codon:yes gene_type:complete